MVHVQGDVLRGTQHYHAHKRCDQAKLIVRVSVRFIQGRQPWRHRGLLSVRDRHWRGGHVLLGWDGAGAFGHDVKLHAGNVSVVLDGVTLHICHNVNPFVGRDHPVAVGVTSVRNCLRRKPESPTKPVVIVNVDELKERVTTKWTIEGCPDPCDQCTALVYTWPRPVCPYHNLGLGGVET